MSEKPICPICKGKGKLEARCGEFEVMTFIIPNDAVPLITAEIKRLSDLAGLTTNRPAVRRGLALEYMAILSSQTPAESLT